MSKRSSELLLNDMFHAIERIEDYTVGIDKSGFLVDLKTADAVVRNLEIVGEAASRLPTEFRNSAPGHPMVKYRWAEEPHRPWLLRN
jgi:uncharacterized protein with HEPN domain